MSKVNGRELNVNWAVNATHALYREDGTWYHRLKNFPGALFDATGYVLFHSKEDFFNCSDLRIGKQTHCPKGICAIPNYVRITGANNQADDVGELQENERRSVMTSRVVRDSPLSRRIKRLHNNQCQVCGLALILGDGISYAEAHHIKPLGSKHNGPDIAANILCVCPNCHAQLDYGGIQLNKNTLRMVKGHAIKEEYIAYHNEVIHRSTRRDKDSSLQQTALPPTI